MATESDTIQIGSRLNLYFNTTMSQQMFGRTCLARYFS